VSRESRPGPVDTPISVTIAERARGILAASGSAPVVRLFVGAVVRLHPDTPPPRDAHGRAVEVTVVSVDGYPPVAYDAALVTVEGLA
jgi:hypothetical protein